MSLKMCPVGVFIGGTSGIGEHTAYAFVRHTTSPRLYIVGRKQQQADRVIQACLAINPNATAQFIKGDMSLIKEAESVANTIKAKETKINLLEYSAGGEVFGPVHKTTEGVDAIFAVSVYSRCKIYSILAPLVAEAGNMNEPARILSIASGSRMVKLTSDLMEPRDTYGLSYFNDYTSAMLSLTHYKLAREYPGIGVIHAHPGRAVRTNLMQKVPWYLRYPMIPFTPLMESADSCGERMFKLGYSDPKFASGPFLVGPDMETCNEKFEHKGWLSVEDQDLASQHVSSRQQTQKQEQ